MESHNNETSLEKARTSGDGMEQEAVPAKKDIQENSSNGSGILNSSRGSTQHRKDSVSLQEHLYERRSYAEMQPASAATASASNLPGMSTLYRRPDNRLRTLAPSEPRGELVVMKPRLVSVHKQLPEHKKDKPPKFVPYEPYPGAVTSLVPLGKGPTKTAIKNSRNHLEIGELVKQMQTMRTQELEGEKAKLQQTPVSNEELQQLQEQLKKSQAERDYYHSQFTFQTKVNAELKNLLVASVGEDLQTRVNLLTEDKLQLARALLDTANNLTTHTEQIEFLASQSEVWRSKFLACSFMVEELARWKADLTQKNQLLTDANKRLLETMQQLRDMQLEMLKNLKFLAKIRYLNLPAADVVSLSAENVNIVQQMVLHTGVGIPENLNICCASTDPLSEVEKEANKALEFMNQPLMPMGDALCALLAEVNKTYARNAAKTSQEEDKIA